MKEYENLIEALVGMAEITRPVLDTKDDGVTLRQKRIQHGICDMLEDAAVAIDELMKRIGEEVHEERTHAAA